MGISESTGDVYDLYYRDDIHSSLYPFLSTLPVFLCNPLLSRPLLSGQVSPKCSFPLYTSLHRPRKLFRLQESAIPAFLEIFLIDRFHLDFHFFSHALDVVANLLYKKGFTIPDGCSTGLLHTFRNTCCHISRILFSVR